MTTSWVTELVSDLRKLGFQVAIETDGYRIYRSGELIRTADGIPLVIHTSPKADNRTRKNTIARLIRARVLEEDPRVTERKRELARDPEVKAAREKARALKREEEMRISQADREKQLREQDSLRSRVQVAAQQLGTVADLAALMAAERPDLWRAKNTAQVAMSTFTRRTTVLNETRADALTRILDGLGVEQMLPPEKPQDKYVYVANGDSADPPAESARMTFKQFLGYETSPLRRFDRGGVTETETSWVCECGKVYQKDSVDRLGKQNGLRNVKLHVSTAHVEEVCPECRKWFKVAGLGPHKKAAHGLGTRTASYREAAERGPDQGEKPGIVPASQTTEDPTPTVESTPLATEDTNEMTLEEAAAELGIDLTSEAPQVFQVPEDIVRKSITQFDAKTDLMVEVTRLLKWFNDKVGA